MKTPNNMFINKLSPLLVHFLTPGALILHNTTDVINVNKDQSTICCFSPDLAIWCAAAIYFKIT